MMNQNFTLDKFTEPITSLADTPQMSASELKRRFQAPSDELLEAHNALAACVSGITDATYPDTVTENMLSDTVRDKIDAKADLSTVLEKIADEAAARETADSSLSARLTSINNVAVGKCRLVTGSYAGNGTSQRSVSLPLSPQVAIVSPNDDLGLYFVVQGGVCYAAGGLEQLSLSGSQLKLLAASRLNSNGVTYNYIAFA